MRDGLDCRILLWRLCLLKPLRHRFSTKLSPRSNLDCPAVFRTACCVCMLRVGRNMLAAYSILSAHGPREVPTLFGQSPKIMKLLLPGELSSRKILTRLLER